MNKDVKLTKEWIERFVIGLRLCPFAHFSFYSDTILYDTSQNSKLADCLDDLMDMIIIMHDAEPDQISNAFLILNESLTFEFLLSLKEKIDNRLDKSELSGIFQTVVFHPAFQFADEKFQAAGNFTNRSPLPMIHVLRVDEVAHAIEVTAEVDQIPFRNKEVLEEMNIKSVSEIFEDDFMDKIKQSI